MDFLPLPEPSTHPTGVDLWLLDLDCCKELSPQIYLEALPTEELTRAQKFNAGQNQFLLTRLFLREALARYTGIAPRDIDIARTPNGKPFLANTSAPLHFNLSHTSNVAALAVSAQGELGVDIEILEERNFLRIAHRYFHAKEVEQLQSCNETERATLFFKLWTLKEAFLKATGEGIANGLNKVSFSFGEDSITASFDKSLQESPDDWQFQQAILPKNLLVALALKSKNTTKTQWFYGNELSNLG